MSWLEWDECMNELRRVVFTHNTNRSERIIFPVCQRARHNEVGDDGRQAHKQKHLTVRISVSRAKP